MRQLIIFPVVVMTLMMISCNKPVSDLSYEDPDKKIIFLHHSTGANVWYGDIEQNKRFYFGKSMCMVPRLLKEYNETNNTKFSIEERNFPSGKPYPWKNDPYDYYNIWVKNAGDVPYMEEPTLEILTKEYDIIIFKHCFPVSAVQEDDQKPDANSEVKTIANYKLQYEALKEKLNSFPDTKFILWTGAALIEPQTSEGEALRAREFFNWVANEWNVSGDNIEIFDFRNIETEGALYLKSEYAVNPASDSHPNRKISARAAESLVRKITEVASE